MKNTEAEKQKKKLDYKWVIVALCFLMVLTTLGFASSTGSLFIGPVSDALGIDRGIHSIYKSFRFVTSAVVNIFFGTLISKFGAKKLIAAGFASLVASMVTFALTPNVFWLYVGGILLGLGFSWTTTTMVGYVINRWISENRGTVMGAILAANGIGGAIATWIVTPIIYREGDNLGYKTAYLVIATILLCVGVVVMVFFKNSPKGQENKVTQVPQKRGRGQSWVGIEYKQAVRKPYFYGALICIFFTGFVLQGISGVAVQYMKDVGMSSTLISTSMTAHSLALFAFKFLTGFLYDKKGLRITVNICSFTAVAVVLMLAFVSDSPLGIVLALIYSIFSSLALPLETIMLPIYASDLFGEKSFNKMLGLFVSVNTAGYALGAPALGLWYDIFGSYKYGFITCSIAMLVVVTALQFVMSAAAKTRREVILAETDSASEN